MKKRMLGYMIASCFFITASVTAQDTTTAGEDVKQATKKTGQAIKKTAEKVGNKTAEIASKGKAAVVDKVYEGKCGPDGQKIYINDESKYYWVDKKGHHQFVLESELNDKKSK